MTSITSYLRTLPAATVAGTVTRAVDAVLAWQDRARSRQHLVELDDRMLADMGLDRATVIDEARKSFWQA